jgi:peptidase E
MSMDAIIVGGGSTLNMMAIWKAQGIDTLLKKAYLKGCVMAGGSAGSLCWFKEGLTDSRPQRLTLVSCLGFIPTSHCPHYHSEPTRRPLYHDYLIKKELQPGYAVDDAAGILFQNETYIKSLALNDQNHTYFVSAPNGIIKEEDLPVTEIIH